MNYEEIYNECVITRESNWRQSMTSAEIEKAHYAYFTGISKNGRRTRCAFIKVAAIPLAEVEAAKKDGALDLLLERKTKDLLTMKDEIISIWKQDKNTLFWKVRSKYRNKEYHFIRLEPIKS